jgi:hypothetical protein
MILSTNPQETTQSTVNNQVASTLVTADAGAAQSVQTFGQVHQARLALRSRIAASAVAQYGANSSQAQAAQATVASSRLTVARIAIVRSQVTATAPQIAAGGWALYGHVFDSDLNPVSAYTVFFVDSKNTWLREYGFAYTAADGSFQLSFQGVAGAVVATPQLFIEVVNDNAMPVYISTSVFQPTIGSPTYQDITLPVGQPVIGDPPPEIREVAIPDSANASQTEAQVKNKKP